MEGTAQMTHDQTQHGPPVPSRRTIAKGAAWAVPAVAVAAATPAMAASLRKDPGINGWVMNSPESDGSCFWGTREYRLEVSSIQSGSGPDGAPFGLYLYDTEPANVISNASITYWILGDHSASSGSDTYITWSTLSGHSTCWYYQGRVGTEVKPDGLIYTGYRWTYNCAIDPTNITVGSDGIGRVFLGQFRVRTNWFEQPSTYCSNLTYWTQRHITIDPDGNGPDAPVVHTFQRRNGSLGPYTGSSGNRIQSFERDVEALEAQIAELDARILALEPQPAEDAATTATDDAGVSDERARLIQEKADLEAQRAQASMDTPVVASLT